MLIPQIRLMSQVTIGSELRLLHLARPCFSFSGGWWQFCPTKEEAAVLHSYAVASPHAWDIP